MFAGKMPLSSILGLLTLIVFTGLAFDYCRLSRRPARWGLGIAILGIIAGLFFTLNAVIPDTRFYGPVFSEVKTSRRIVALTFDDGPYPPYTGQILDILKRNGVRATFFIIGRNAAAYPEMVRRMAAEGHQVGNHTYNHVDLLKADQQAIAAEIDRTNQIVAGIIGQSPQVVRPPHGFRDGLVMDIMADRQLKVVEWSVMSRDWLNPGVETIVDRTLSGVKSGAVILLHDGDGVAGQADRSQTVTATDIIIKRLLAQGYMFVTVNEILADGGEK